MTPLKKKFEKFRINQSSKTAGHTWLLIWRTQQEAENDVSSSACKSDVALTG